MNIGTYVIAALMFAVFAPGGLVRIPVKGSRMTVLAVHAVVFALVTGLVMNWYFHGVLEFMTNYGTTCPNGYVEGPSKTGAQDCIPVGHATYATDDATGQPKQIPVPK